MSRRVVKPRIAWEDRFASPDADDLGSIHQDSGRADRIGPARGWSGSAMWWSRSCGTGCRGRWTFAFALDSEPERPWAYLVPQPGRPLLRCRYGGDIAALPMRKLSRSVRDG